MRAFEIPIRLSEGKLEIPETILRQLPHDQPMRMIILVEEGKNIDENSSWEQLTRDEFLAGYNEQDSIYDRL